MSITQIFNNPWAKKGGMTIVNGQRIPGHIEKGHDDHLHVATDNAEDMLSVIKKARDYGLRTSENPSALNDPDGKLNIVHTRGSKHYKVFRSNPKVGAAVDITGSQPTIEKFIGDYLLVDSNFPGTAERTKINTKLFKKYSDYGGASDDSDSDDSDSDEYSSDNLTGDSGYSSISGEKSVMPVDAIKVMVEKLKEKNIKSEDLKKLTNISSGQDIDLSDVNEKNAYEKILEGIGAKPTPENMKFMLAWRQQEGHGGKFNPFNTTQPWAGATKAPGIAGVKNYLTLEDGINATIKTLLNGYYGCIVDGLRKDIGANQIALCKSLEVWGTNEAGKNHLLDVLKSYDAGAKPSIKPLA